MEKEKEIREVIDALTRLEEDKTVPKNAKTRIEEAIKLLNNEEEPSLKVSKVLNELDEISANNNIETYTRTQIWNIVSMLEKI